MHELATTLTGAKAISQGTPSTRLLAEGYPTGALAEFSIAGQWRQLGEGAGRPGPLPVASRPAGGRGLKLELSLPHADAGRLPKLKMLAALKDRPHAQLSLGASSGTTAPICTGRVTILALSEATWRLAARGAAALGRPAGRPRGRPARPLRCLPKPTTRRHCPQIAADTAGCLVRGQRAQPDAAIRRCDGRIDGSRCGTADGHATPTDRTGLAGRRRRGVRRTRAVAGHRGGPRRAQHEPGRRDDGDGDERPRQATPARSPSAGRRAGAGGGVRQSDRPTDRRYSVLGAARGGPRRHRAGAPDARGAAAATLLPLHISRHATSGASVDAAAAEARQLAATAGTGARLGCVLHRDRARHRRRFRR